MKNFKFAISSADKAPNTAPILLCGDVYSALERASKFGYDAIEVHTRETAEWDFDRIKEICKTQNVKIAMLITGRINTEGKLNLIDDIPYVTEFAVAGMKKYVDLAVNCGAEGLVIGWVRGNVPNGGDRNKYMKRLADNIRIIADYAKTKNITINIEVINRYEINTFTTCRETLDFIKEHNLDNCYVHLDTFHMNIDEENPYETIKLAGKYLGYIHFADNSRKYPGSGMLDFKKTMETLEEISYDGYISVECLPYPDHDTAAKRAIEHLK